MDDLQRINDQLAKYPEEIYKATTRTEELREKWMLADARKDYEQARAFLNAKAAMGLTVGEADRKATEDVYETTQAVIMAESSFRRALADQVRLENEFTAVRKQAELLKLTEQHMGRAA